MNERNIHRQYLGCFVKLYIELCMCIEFLKSRIFVYKSVKAEAAVRAAQQKGKHSLRDKTQGSLFFVFSLCTGEDISSLKPKRQSWKSLTIIFLHIAELYGPEIWEVWVGLKQPKSQKKQWNQLQPYLRKPLHRDPPTICDLHGTIKLNFMSVELLLWYIYIGLLLPRWILIPTLLSPPPPSSSYQCPSSEIIPVGWGHVAEPVRLNPNQFLSDGHRKVPNRVYAQLIQSACGWGEDVCAIMSSLISFRKAGRQTGRPAWRGWCWKNARYQQAWLDQLSANVHAVEGSTGENPRPKPQSLGTVKEGN